MPAVVPGPVTMLTVPGGMPAFSMISTNFSASMHSMEAGLTMQVLPEQMAPASFTQSPPRGTFQG